MDTAQEDSTRDFFAKFPEWKYLRSAGGNIGYGASYNEIFKKFPGSDYFLLVTSDVLLDLSAVKKFIAEMERDKEIAICAGNYINGILRKICVQIKLIRLVFPAKKITILRSWTGRKRCRSV